jgi:antitoxin component YwqK of YwqJK toxin-antitoxin module
MKKILLIVSLICISTIVFSQEKKVKVFYIVDNVPIIDEPDENSGTVSNDDIEELLVVTDKEKIKQTGYDADKIIYITTKEYKKRSEEIRKIPTTKTMDRKDGVWYLKNVSTPYSGKFIDYFFNGKIQGEGNLNNGVINGIRTVYYQYGNKRYYYTYENGIQTGDSEEYFTNGKLKQKGSFVAKKQVGVWKRFYSTGELKDQITFINEKPKLTKEEEKYYNLQNKALDLMKEEDYKSAIKKLDDAEKLNNKVSDLYFYRGTAKLDDFNFDAALIDFDKAIELEPMYMEAIANRAFVRIRKFEFKGSRTLSQTHGVTVLATKAKVEIPKDELAKICADLKNCYELGDKKDMILDAMKTYCQ